MLTMKWLKNLKKKHDVGKNLKLDEVFIKLVKDELVELLGGYYVTETEKSLIIIIKEGLQGTGKTTTTGKIDNLVRKKYKKNFYLLHVTSIELQ